jgi:DNA-directed RNA polymerase I, II, and III subunit RPABC3
VGENVQLVLASSLSLDGTNDAEQSKMGWRDVDEAGSLADSFDYVCHGNIYRFEESNAENM